jgi:hypothetical protein
MIKCSPDLVDSCLASLKRLAADADWRVRFGVLWSGTWFVQRHPEIVGRAELMEIVGQCEHLGATSDAVGVRILGEMRELFQRVLRNAAVSGEIPATGLRLVAQAYCSSFAEMMEELEWEVDAGGYNVLDQLLHIRNLRPSDTDEIVRQWNQSPSITLRKTAQAYFNKLRRK